MQYRDSKKILKDLDVKLEKLVMRNFIKDSLGAEYKEDLVYIVYDDFKIEVYDESFLEVNKSFKHIKSYFISKPFK